MKILILGLNYAPEKVGIAVYTAGMAQALVTAGHSVHVVAGQPYYPAWKIMDGYSAHTYSRSIEDGVDVTRAPHYIPANPTGARRLLHHISFAMAAFLPMLWRSLHWQPDVVMTIAPSLIGAPVARLAALISGSKSWLHVQDFEVEAAFATGLMDRNKLLSRLALWFERKVLSAFHVVSTISPQMCAKLLEKSISADKVVELRNWSDISAISPLDAPSSYRSEWAIQTPHVALYSGNIGNKQGIDLILHTARLLNHRKDLTFVICGEGPNRSNLEASAQGLDNIQFRDLQPVARLNELVGLATIHLLPQLADAADLVLPSKLTNMLASGRPVVGTAKADTGLAAEIEGCGIVTPPGDVAAFAAAVENLMDDPENYRRCALEARIRAEERWHGKVILQGLMNRFSRMTGHPARPVANTDAASDRGTS